jgi:hypothetical protein
MSSTARRARITDLSISFPSSLSSPETETITSSLLDRKIHEITNWQDGLWSPLKKEEASPEIFLEKGFLRYHIGKAVDEMFPSPRDLKFWEGRRSQSRKSLKINATKLKEHKRSHT